MKINEIYRCYLESGLVDTDTRKIRKNSMFFALRGENFNGNEFAIDALHKGAKYAVVDDKNIKGDPRIIVVEDVLETLQKLANYHRNKLNIPIIESDFNICQQITIGSEKDTFLKAKDAVSRGANSIKFISKDKCLYSSIIIFH